MELTYVAVAYFTSKHHLKKSIEYRYLKLFRISCITEVPILQFTMIGG